MCFNEIKSQNTDKIGREGGLLLEDLKPRNRENKKCYKNHGSRFGLRSVHEIFTND